MWPLLAVVVALVDAATSRTESLDFKNVQNAMPLRLNSVLRKPEVDQLDKFDSPPGVGHFLEDLEGPEAAKYRSGFEPFKKLSILDDLEGSSTDQRIPVVEDNDDTDIDQLSAFLTQLLQEPGGWEAPLVFVEEPAITWDESVIENTADGSEVLPAPWKRSRYYRRYPWKRQNSRNRYDDSSRYLCTPTREDVFQLLVALHEARQGNKSGTVNFCNRRRPAGAVFTNIRFLGRRK